MVAICIAEFEQIAIVRVMLFTTSCCQISAIALLHSWICTNCYILRSTVDNT